MAHTCRVSAIVVTLTVLVTQAAVSVVLANDSPSLPVAERVPASPVDVTILETVSLPWQDPEVIISTTASAESLHVAVLIDGVAGPTLDDTNLVAGTNLIAVEMHQANASSSDIWMALKLEGVVITNSPTLAGLVINEVLANNVSIHEPDNSTPDWVELFNPSNASFGSTFAAPSFGVRPLNCSVNAALSLSLELSFVPVRTPEEFGAAFSAISRAHAQALYLLENPLVYVHKITLAKLASIDLETDYTE